jgi:hypothetical protein
VGVAPLAELRWRWGERIRATRAVASLPAQSGVRWTAEIGFLDPKAVRAARATVESRPSLAMVDDAIDEFCS